jgi:type IV secretory pathway TrbL component
MEKLNGRIQKVGRRSKKQALDMGRTGSHTRSCLLGLICLIPLLTSCALKKALIVGGAAGLGATAGSVISGGVIAPIVGAAISATATDVVVTALEPASATQALEITGDAPVTIVQEAAPNFFSLLSQLVETGGWLLLLVVLVPMILGWILPGPLERKKKNTGSA